MSGLYSPASMRAFAAGQYAWDNAAEPDPDERYTREDARDEAEDEVMHTPYSLAAALYDLVEVPSALDPVDVCELCAPEFDAAKATSGQLLAVLINGDGASALAARTELRERLCVQVQPEITMRANELYAMRETA